MQIVCPRCSATYAVPDTALTAPGREVQCAACNRTWFHLIAAPPPPAAAPVPPEAPPKTAPEAPREGSGATDWPDPAPPVPQPDTAQRRELSPDVLKILREEAAYEAARRKEDAAGRRDPIEARQAVVARTTQAGRAAAEERPTRSDAPAAWSPRNLPVAMSDADRAEAETRQRRRGFRAGFALTAGAACAALVLYLAAPTLARTIPGAAPVAEKIASHGDRLQATLADLVRRTVGGATNG